MSRGYSSGVMKPSVQRRNSLKAHKSGKARMSKPRANSPPKMAVELMINSDTSNPSPMSTRAKASGQTSTKGKQNPAILKSREKTPTKGKSTQAKTPAKKQSQARKPNTRASRLAKETKTKRNTTGVGLSHNFHTKPETTDRENAEGMFKFLLTDRSPKDRGCSKIVESGCSQVLACKCLARITESLQTVDDQKKEEWIILFTKFARALRPIATEIPAKYSKEDPPTVPVHLLIQFMEEFRHVIQRTCFNAVKGYVVRTPMGSLQMDFNGIAELGGYAYKRCYERLYQVFLTTHGKDRLIGKLYVWKMYKKQALLDVFLAIIQVCSENQEHPQRVGSNLKQKVQEHRRNTEYYLHILSLFDYYKKRGDKGYKRKQNNKEEKKRKAAKGNNKEEKKRKAAEGNKKAAEGNKKAVKAVKPRKKVTDKKKHTQSTCDPVPAWNKFFERWTERFIIAHPEIPLNFGAWSVPTRHYNSHCLLATHESNGSTKGNIGVMTGIADGFAKMLVEQLHLFVKWDGSLLNGGRRIEFFTHEDDSIIPLLDSLKREMGMACRTLLPDLLPEDEYVFQFVGEVSLCPAPQLNDMQEEYNWSYSQPKAPSEEFIGHLAEHKIFAFWGFFPLTQDGMFLNLMPRGTESKLVFVPPQTGLLCPIQIPCGHRLRTSIMGSPACKFCIYLVPKTLDLATVNQLFAFHDSPVPEPGYVDDMLEDLGRLVGF
jgi:hypothetical protein